MKSLRKFSYLILILGIVLLSANAFAEGQIKVIANANNGETIEDGEDLGVTLLLNGTGSYDVYAALAGGVLQDAFLFFDANGGMVLDLVPLRSNLDLGSLSTKEKIIELLPKLSLGGVGIAGTYTFYVALCNTGQLDFVALDLISITLE